MPPPGGTKRPFEFPLRSFVAWFEAVQPKVVAREIVVWNDQYGYAGTVDLICEIAGDLYIIDFKTGQHVWPEYELQVSAYKHAVPQGQDVEGLEGIIGKDFKLGILQVGYKRNKTGWKFTAVEDKFNLFLAARQIWANETAGEKPLQKDYPLTLQAIITTASEGTEADVKLENK